MRRSREAIGKVSPEEAFRRVLRHLRKERGLTQETLGFEAGLHRTAIGLLERGLRVPSISTLYKLAPPLGTTPAMMLARADELVTRSRTPTPKSKEKIR
jgi:transcriptional regulator with XRE-family HTH domain